MSFRLPTKGGLIETVWEGWWIAHRLCRCYSTFRRPGFSASHLLASTLLIYEANPYGELLQEVERLAAKALTDFNDRAEGRLDFSEASLQIVEEMLAEAALYRQDLGGDVIEGLVTRFGCYILEVGRRQFGGPPRRMRDKHHPDVPVNSTASTKAPHCRERMGMPPAAQGVQECHALSRMRGQAPPIAGYRAAGKLWKARRS